MKQVVVQRWAWAHKWSSLVCTFFLLTACATGLPLIFGEEVSDWLNTDPPYAEFPSDTPNASLDLIMSRSYDMYPGEIVTSLFLDDDEPKVVVSMAPSWERFRANPKSRHWIKFDSRSAKLLKRSDPDPRVVYSFMGVMLKMHRELFAGLPGRLFMGLMGLLFLIAIVSGVVVYEPFMRKLEFGTIRPSRSRRVMWLDFHNLLGIVAVLWMSVLGLTGVINAFSTPLTGLWLMNDVRPVLETFKNKPVIASSDMSSLQHALDLIKTKMPDMVVTSITFPGAEYGTPWHYVMRAKGKTALSSRLVSFAVVDARDGSFDRVVQMPWYLRMLEISRPLHFGDYGGFPLKIIWALLDIVTITVLGTGLYLWWAKRRPFIEETGNVFTRGALRIGRREQSEALE